MHEAIWRPTIITAFLLGGLQPGCVSDELGLITQQMTEHEMKLSTDWSWEN
jgi:hypothetical protein